MRNVAIFGVPRSGTSWLGQIFNSSPQVAYRYQPIFAYSFKDTLSEYSSSEDIRQFHSNLLATNDDFVCQKKNISGNSAPRFEKKEITHLVWKEVRYLNIIENLIKKSSIKVIGIVRHPCGVLKSWMTAPKEFDSDWDISEQWRSAEKKNSGPHEFYGYERWLHASQMFMELEKTYPEQFRLITYETLLTDLARNVNFLFNFIGLKMTEQTEIFLEKSTSTSSKDPYGVYRENKNGYEWLDKLPIEIIREISSDGRFKKINHRYKWK